MPRAKKVVDSIVGYRADIDRCLVEIRHKNDVIKQLDNALEEARRERDEARATVAEMKEHGIDIDNGVWTGRVRLPDGSSPMTDEIEEAFVERDALRDECARLRVIEQAALYVLNAQDEGDLLDAERRVAEAFRSDATKPTKERP